MVDHETLEQQLDEVKIRAQAHENSAGYHYRWDTRLGSAAKILSAVIGTGVFAGLVSQLGLDGNGKSSLSVPPGWEWLYWIVLAVCLAGPAVTALQLALHNAEDARKHMKSFSDYRSLAGDLQVFLSQPALDSSVAQQSQKEFNDRFKNIVVNSIPLAPHAKKEVGL